MTPPTPLQYLAQEFGVREIGKLTPRDRDILKRWAADEMAVLGIANPAAVSAT